MPYWHITLASRGRATLFPSEAELRMAVGKLATVNGEQALLYCLVDDHLHDVIDAPTLRLANELCRRIRLTLRSVARAPFFARDVAPVETRAHLKALVRYVLKQPKHHGLSVHPALWSGSCFLDLAGARCLPTPRSKLKEALPRLRWQDLLDMVGLPPDALSPATDEQLSSLGVARIAQATAAALNVAPEMVGMGRAMVSMRHCVVALARRGGFKSADLKRQLGWPTRSIMRYSVGVVPDTTLVAVRRRLALEELVRCTSSQGVAVDGPRQRLVDSSASISQDM